MKTTNSQALIEWLKSHPPTLLNLLLVVVEEHLVRLSWVNVRLTAEGGHVVVAGEDCEGSGGKRMKAYFRSFCSCSRTIKYLFMRSQHNEKGTNRKEAVFF